MPQNISSIPKGDRSEFVPIHRGYSVFPNYDLFAQLLRHAHQNLQAVRDVNSATEKTYGDLLSDALKLRAVLAEALPPQVLEAIGREDEVYVGILTPGGYEYAVAMMAVLSLGVAAVPMSMPFPFFGMQRT